MEYHVNENCIGCGLCTSICPDIFVLNAEGFARAKNNSPQGKDAELAREAMDNCPTNAIEERSIT